MYNYLNNIPRNRIFLLPDIRKDGCVFSFACVDLSGIMDIHYGQMLTQKNYLHGYKILCCGGNRIHTKKRKAVMFQYGSTIGATRYPFFLNPKSGKYSMLPRLVVKSRLGNIGDIIMKNHSWFGDLCRDAERIALDFLEADDSVEGVQVQKHIWTSKRIIPSCLRICNTFFTQVVVVGPMQTKEGVINHHVDSGDYINVLISIGDSSVKGGETVYYNGQSEKEVGDVVISHKFKHGRAQVGYSYNQVFHGSTPWTGGYRGVLNFSLKKSVIHHFYKYGSRYYDQFVKAGYPSKDFVAL